MADDRTLAPTPQRWSQAWQAGLRPWSAWLWPAAACGLLALAIGRLRESGEAWLELSPAVSPGAVVPEAFVGSLAAWLAGVLAVAGLATVGLALLSQRLGWISAIEQQRLLPAPARPAVLGRIVLCTIVGMGLVLALAGVLAGSARAVDASEAGLFTLWLGWAERACVVLAVGLSLGAIVELLLDRRDRERQLWQTPQAVRDEARAAGGRSR
jgi:hypothetical protein